MNNSIKHAFSFILGAGAGAFASFMFLKKRFDKRLDAELSNIRDYYEYKKLYALKKETEQEEEKPDFTQKSSIKKIPKQDPVDYTSFYQHEPETEDDEDEALDISNEDYSPPDPIQYTEGPYEISPSEFVEFEEYNKITLVYYNDGTVADEDFEILSRDDVRNAIGEDFANHYGEYEDDCVYIRNDALRCDYEVIKDLRNYEDAVPEYIARHKNI